VSVRGGHIMASCATGTTQLLAAPPAGYLRVITSFQAKNAHASSALTYRLHDADGDFYGPSGNTVAAGAVSQSATALGLTCVTDSAVSITVSGTGTPAEVLAEWHQVPKPAGWAVGVVALTTTYQAIPNVVPTAGLARVRGTLQGPESALSGLTVWNGDAGNIQTGYRLIRAGVTFDWVNGGGGASPSTTSYARSVFASQLVLQPGDQLLTRVAAITVPGAAVLRMGVEKMYTA